MAARGSRLEKSVYTFGLAGRILWTLASLGVLYLLLSPLARILHAGLISAGMAAIVPLFLAVAGIVLMVWVWPRFLRDLWQPASAAGDELTRLRDRTRREAELAESLVARAAVEPLSQRNAPTRW